MASLGSGLQNRASLAELIRTLPPRQLLLLWLAIFSTFASIGFMLDIILGGRFPIVWLALTGLVSGGLAVAFTATSLRRVVEEVTTPQFALGMFAEARFTSAQVKCRSGDLLALLTDGLIEVFDTANRELGFEWAKTVLGQLADRPLPEIADRLLADARSYGAQTDDQTVLLIRRAKYQDRKELRL